MPTFSMRALWQIRGLLSPSPDGRLGGAGGLQSLKEMEWFGGFDWAALQAGTLLPPEQQFSFARKCPWHVSAA